MIKTNVNVLEEKGKLSKTQLTKYYIAVAAVDSMYEDKMITKKQADILKARAVMCCRYLDLRDELNQPGLDERTRNQMILEARKCCKYQGDTYEDVKDVTDEFDKRFARGVEIVNSRVQVATQQKKAA